MIDIPLILQHSRWTLASAIVNMAIQALLFMMMAHYVDPAQLGHFFLASALIFIPLGILEYSFTSSLIHTDAPSAQDYQAVLYINGWAGALLILLSSILAYGLSTYYDAPFIGYYYLTMLPVLVLMLLTSIQNAGLRKDLKIKHFAAVAIGSSLLYFIVASLLLVSGYGVQALIAGHWCKALGMALALIFTTSYLSLDFKNIKVQKKKHLQYGQYIMAEKAFGVGLSYLDVFIVHHFLGAQVLGIYDLLKRFMMRPVMTSYQAIESVVFPMLTKVKKDPVALQNTFNSLTKISSLFFGVFALLFFSAPILSLLPEVYHSYCTLFRLIIIYAAAHIVVNPVDILAYTLDKTRPFFIWTVGFSVLQVSAMICGLYYGVEGLMITMIGSLLIFYVISYFILIKGALSLSSWLHPLLRFLALIGLALLILRLLNLDF